MCRFLLVKTKNNFKPQKLLLEFSLKCKISRASDGDWQGDGWGIAIKIKNWQVYKSLKPIWEEKDKFNQFAETNTFAVHARSAYGENTKGVLDFNQPYIKNNLCFVFNGNLKGVSLKQKINGKIGAQKIFFLYQKLLKSAKPAVALRLLYEILKKNSQQIIGMNIGLIVDKSLYALCEYLENPAYFALNYYQDNNLSLCCSEKIGEYPWQTMKKGQILVL